MLHPAVLVETRKQLANTSTGPGSAGLLHFASVLYPQEQLSIHGGTSQSGERAKSPGPNNIQPNYVQKPLTLKKAAASVRTASPTRVVQSPPVAGGFATWPFEATLYGRGEFPRFKRMLQPDLASGYDYGSWVFRRIPVGLDRLRRLSHAPPPPPHVMYNASSRTPRQCGLQ